MKLTDLITTLFKNTETFHDKFFVGNRIPNRVAAGGQTESSSAGSSNVYSSRIV